MPTPVPQNSDGQPRFTVRVGAVELAQAPLGQIAEALRQLETRVRRGRQQLMQDRFDLGVALLEVRRQFGERRRTGFLRWLTSVGLHKTTARRCMATAKFVGADQRLSVAKVRAALDEASEKVQAYVLDRIKYRTEPARKVSRRETLRGVELADAVGALTDEDLAALASRDLEVLAGVRDLGKFGAVVVCTGAVGGVAGSVVGKDQSGDARSRQNLRVAAVAASAKAGDVAFSQAPERDSHAPGAPLSLAPERTDSLAVAGLVGVEDELIDDDEDLGEVDERDLEPEAGDDAPSGGEGKVGMVGATGEQLGLDTLYDEIQALRELVERVVGVVARGGADLARVREAVQSAERELERVVGDGGGH